MLSTVLLAALFASSHARAAGTAACPSGPLETFASTAQICDAIEVTGRIDPGAIALDPAFDVRVPLAAMTRPAQGPVLLSAFDRNGAQLFAFPFAAQGSFRLTLPLSARVAQNVYRLTLASGPDTAQRVGTNASEPNVETIAVSDDAFVFIWNASAFPGVRIEDARDRTPVVEAQGSGTYEQLDVRSSRRTFVVWFSDGVRSIERTLTVFGR